jgi:5-deoxy-glucuronate isomerase
MVTSSLRVRPTAPDAAGKVLDITPQSARWRYIGFSVVKRARGETFSGYDPLREICLVIISGAARVTVGGVVFDHVGGRRSPFTDAAPGAVYVPMAAAFAVEALSELELAVCSAPGAAGHVPRLISNETMAVKVRGEGTNRRFVRNILPDDQPAHSLIVVEVITPSGHWSSYPPHKHDAASQGEETALEETYYHRLEPPQGFAMQRVYTDDRSLDEAVVVEDGDVVLVPRGYHPVVAPHGYELYYLNVMAGPERKWIFRNDPQHEWMLAKNNSLR